jgi:hypothetical protein
VCDNGTSVGVRKRYSVALGSLGTPLSSIEEYLCHYGVRGAPPSAGSQYGLTVTVDGNGFKQCVTTTGPSFPPSRPPKVRHSSPPADLALGATVCRSWT